MRPRERPAGAGCLHTVRPRPLPRGREASPFWRPPAPQDPGGRGGDAGGATEFGNAVASRWPLLDREELRLPDAGDGETRAALSVGVRAPPGPVCFTVAHLNWKFRHGAVRERQVVALCDLVLRRRPRGGFPPLLAGDFDAEPESAEIRYVAGLQSLEGRSVAGRIESCRVVCDEPRDGVWPSDHFGVCARLRTEPLAEAGPAAEAPEGGASQRGGPR